MAYRIGFDIFAKDRASGTFDKLGRKVGETESKFSKHAAAIGAGLATAGVALVGFAKTSIDAYTDAEKSQRVLTDAYQRFPALADVPLQSLRDQAQALQSVTKFDGDATAAAMGQLAAYKLSGAQIQQLTPLLLDYAQKTGKDLPTAANTLGKALLGQGRGLKDIGVNFKDTGSLAGNFAELTGKLRTQVGGFAEQEGKSAEGRAEILKNKFGDLKESIGQQLLPALEGLTNGGIKVLDWLNRTPGAMTAAKVALVVLGAAVVVATGAWVAMNLAFIATPIGAIITGLVLLGVGLVVAYKKSETFRNIVNGALQAVGKVGIWLWNSVFQPVIRFILIGFSRVTSAIGQMLIALGHVPGFGWAKTAGEKMLTAAGAAQRLADKIRQIPDKHVTISVSVHAMTGRISVGGKQVNIGQFATGGYTGRGNKDAIAGVVHRDEYVMDSATVARYGLPFMDALRAGAGTAATGSSSGSGRGGGGDTYITVNVNGNTLGTPDTIARQIQQALLKIQRTGGTNLGFA